MTDTEARAREELKPCPLCGDTPRFYHHEHDVRHIRCQCGLVLYGGKRHFASEDEEIAAWNARPAERADGTSLTKEAFAEARRRYPDALGAIVFLEIALGFASVQPDASAIEWAKGEIARIEAERPDGDVEDRRRARAGDVMDKVSAFILDPEDGEAAIGVSRTGAVLAKFPNLRSAAQMLRYHREYYQAWAERCAAKEGEHE